MSDKIIDYTKERIRLIDEEIKKSKDEERKSTLQKIKENILIFFSDIKNKKIA